MFHYMKNLSFTDKVVISRVQKWTFASSKPSIRPDFQILASHWLRIKGYSFWQSQWAKKKSLNVMDRKSVQPEMKPAPANLTARTGLLVVAVFVVCSLFLLCNYLLLNKRIGAMEEKLETLQRSERPNPNVSFDDQKGVKRMLHIREKRSVSLPDLEKRLRFLEKR